MPGIKTQSIDLLVNGKTIEIKNETRGNFALNKALMQPEQFQKFAANPQDFAAGFGLNIDKDIALQLSEMVGGFTSLEELRNAGPDLTVAATAWAVAAGAYSVASSKIALAF